MSVSQLWRRYSSAAGFGNGAIGASIVFVALLRPLFGPSGQLRWGDRGLEMSPWVALGTGIILFAGVSVAVVALTRHPQGRLDHLADHSNSDHVKEAQSGTTGSTVPEVLAGEETTAGQFALVQTNDGEWVWHALHFETLAASPTGATSRSAAADNVTHLQTALERASSHELEDAAIRISNLSGDDWTWTLVRPDGEAVATAAGDATDREQVEAAVSTLKDRGPDGTIIDIGRGAFALTERDDRWHWHLVDDERTTLAVSSKEFRHREDTESAATAIGSLLTDARSVAVETVAVELEQVEDTDRWTWQIVDSQGETLVDATATFDDRTDAEAAVTTVLEGLESAAVTVADQCAYELFPVESQCTGDSSTTRIVSWLTHRSVDGHAGRPDRLSSSSETQHQMVRLPTSRVLPTRSIRLVGHWKQSGQTAQELMTPQP